MTTDPCIPAFTADNSPSCTWLVPNNDDCVTAQTVRCHLVPIAPVGRNREIRLSRPTATPRSYRVSVAGQSRRFGCVSARSRLPQRCPAAPSSPSSAAAEAYVGWNERSRQLSISRTLNRLAPLSAPVYAISALRKLKVRKSRLAKIAPALLNCGTNLLN